MESLQVIENNSIALRQGINRDMLESFVKFIDAKEDTTRTYYNNIKQFYAYLSLRGITEPTRDDVIAFREELKATGHKPTTVQGYITAVKLFFRWTAEVGIYPNIADHIKGQKVDKENKKDYFTSSQLKAVVNGVDRDSLQGKRDYAMLLLMVTCGLRDIEVSRANIEDMRTVADFTAIYVQGKGKDEKTDFIRLDENTERAIREYLAERKPESETEPLFTSISNNSKGKRLSTRSISGKAKEKMIQAGYDSPRLTAHSLRHTAVTLSLLAGKPLDEVRQFARHQSINTTMIYSHNLDKAKNSCSNAVAQAIFG